MAHRIYIYPIWLRIWHIINGILCLILIATGISMQYTSQESSLIAFRTSVQLHNISGIILLINYLAFIIGNSFTTNGNHYKVVFKGVFSNLKTQFRYYLLGLFKDEKEPFPITEKNKFNPIQRVTYILVMYFICPLIIISGCLMLFPELMNGMIAGIDSYLFLDIVHLSTGFFVSLFLIIHVYFSTISHDKASSRFKSIVTGWHVE